MNASNHDCKLYPYSSCDWCKRAWLVYRWNHAVYTAHQDPVPLSELPVQVMSNFLDFFDVITSQLSREAHTAEHKRELGELYVVARVFLDELARRRERRWLDHACGSWRPMC